MPVKYRAYNIRVRWPHGAGVSAFVDRLIQPTAQKHDSYLKDTTDFLNFIESAKLSKNTVPVSMDVTGLYTNIPQEEVVRTVRHAYEDFYGDKSPIPTKHLCKRNALPYINSKLVLILR